MALHSLPTISFQSLVHDALTLLGLGAVLLAGLAFISLGFLLPGLLTALGGDHHSPRGGYLEFGPSAAPIISEPAPRRGTHAPMLGPSQPSVRPQVRHHLWRGMALHLAPPREVARQ